MCFGKFPRFHRPNEVDCSDSFVSHSASMKPKRGDQSLVHLEFFRSLYIDTRRFSSFEFLGRLWKVAYHHPCRISAVLTAVQVLIYLDFRQPFDLKSAAQTGSILYIQKGILRTGQLERYNSIFVGIRCNFQCATEQAGAFVHAGQAQVTRSHQ